jgi:hypothetical protein
MVPRSPLAVLLLTLLLAVPVAAADEPTTLGATITLRDVNLAELIETAKLDLGYKLTGKVTVVANFSVPLGEAAETKNYVLQGKVTAPELMLDDLKVRDFTAELGYAAGKLTLTKLTAVVPSDVAGDPAGQITGTASAAIEPRGDLKANLTLTRVPLGILFKTLPGGIDVAGAVSGKADFRAPVDKLSDPATWAGSGTLTAPALTVFGRAIRDTKLTLAVSDGKAVLSEVAAVLEGVPVTGNGSLALSGKYAYSATVRTTPKDVSEIQKLVPELASPVAIKGKLALDATAAGTLTPFTVTASGNVSAADLAVGGTAGEKFSAKWKVTQDRVTVTDVTAGLFKGTLTGSADVPLGRDAAGDFKLAFKDIDAAAVLATFPSIPVRLTGTISGDITGKLPATQADEARAVSADVNLAAPELTVQGIPAEKLVGKLSVAGSTLRYELEGQLKTGGSFEVKGQYPEAKKGEKEEDGVIVVRSLDLGGLSRALRLQGTRLQGIVDLSFRYSADLNDGDGRYRIRQLGVNGSLLFQDLGGRLRLRNGTLEVVDAVGPLASGTVRARVRANLNQPERSFYRLDVDRADIGRLLSSFATGPTMFDGGVALTVRGKLWPRFTATGTLVMTRGRLAGMTASDLRIPFRFGATPGGGMLLTVRDVTGSLGGGRVSGQFEYSSGATARTSGQLKFTNVKIGRVLSDLNQSNYFGAARVTGRIDLAGENMLSIDDLRGSVVAKIGQAGLRDLPVLTSVLPFVSPSALVKPFDVGELRGRLSRGVFRLERLTLASSNAELFAEGTVALTGRLDLGVIIRTGSVGLNDAVVRRIGLGLPLTLGPIPIALIRDVSEFLSNRTVRLTITGTTSSPQPRVNTAALLTEEAVRFFLRRYFPIAAEVLPEVSPRTNR